MTAPAIEAPGETTVVAPRTRKRVRCTNVVLLGVGAIGRELLAQLGATRKTVGARARIRVCGLIDRSGYLFDSAGLSRKTLAAVCEHKRGGGRLHECDGGLAAEPLDALAFIAAQVRGRAVLVDATAADTQELLELVLERRWHVVLANKVPIAGEQERVDRLHSVARANRATILNEATVGAGLPVMDTLRKLIDAGDRVLSIEGCPSGTLGFLFGELGRGRRFSEALRDAIAAGYAEPDPRADLSGLDVARKALILGRTIGFRGDLAAIELENLVPAELRGVSVEEFLARASELDDAWARRVAEARERGCVLRYRVRATRRAVTAGLAEVPLSEPLSLLNGTDNQFSFTTARYREQPLVISGPGAGAAVTASGVFGDLMAVA